MAPEPPELHTTVHDYFQREQNLSSTWIRTDFRFASREEATQIIAPIFGNAILDKLIETNDGLI